MSLLTCMDTPNLFRRRHQRMQPRLFWGT